MASRVEVRILINKESRYSRKSLFFSNNSIPEPTPSTMTALHQFGAEMLKLSRGLESFAPVPESSGDKTKGIEMENSTNVNISSSSQQQHKANVEWYANRIKTLNLFLIQKLEENKRKNKFPCEANKKTSLVS